MRCPICKREVTAAPGVHPFPFCSARCKLVDLGNWLDQRYVVRDADGTSEDAEGDGPPRPPDR